MSLPLLFRRDSDQRLHRVLRLQHRAPGQAPVPPLQPVRCSPATAALPHHRRVDMECPVGHHLRQHQRFKSSRRSERRRHGVADVLFLYKHRRATMKWQTDSPKAKKKKKTEKNNSILFFRTSVSLVFSSYRTMQFSEIYSDTTSTTAQTSLCTYNQSSGT
ncbi:hypothetical protein AVEN_153397-1 [Araneus ventricosus]|uniref:Uncharacterized protein n=1 Tax=Araneus ventricosus TaxID=182803 RepID=A0A4Y2FTQ9_ARAVE|nr:hypothetical protein AVEN_153397-1 [Araneus ventricosus]